MTGIGEVAFGHQANGSIVTVNGKAVGSSLIGQTFTDKDGNPIAKYFQSRPSDAVTSSATDNITVGAASNLGPSNPLLIGFIPGVNTVGPRRQASRPATRSPPPPTRTACPCPRARTRPRCPNRAAGDSYARNSDGTYQCDPDTIPQRAIAYRAEFGLAPDATRAGRRRHRVGLGPRPRDLHANADLRPPPWPGPGTCPWPRCSGLVEANTNGRSLGVLGDPGVNVLTLNLALDQCP